MTHDEQNCTQTYILESHEPWLSKVSLHKEGCPANSEASEDDAENLYTPSLLGRRNRFRFPLETLPVHTLFSATESDCQNLEERAYLILCRFTFS